MTGMPVERIALLMVCACAAGPPTLATTAPNPANEDSVAEDEDEDEEGLEGLTLGEIVACEQPAASPSWREVGATMGLVAAPDPSGLHGAGGMLAVTDVDGDGELDVVTVFPSAIHVQHREGEAFAFSSTESTLDTYILSTADLNADGIEDLLLGGPNPRVLGWKDGFIKAGYLLGMDPQTEPIQGLFANDLDLDGRLDLFAMTNTIERPDFMLHSTEDGIFEADYDMIPEELGAGQGFDAQWFDWDGDLDRDLYLVNDRGPEFGPNVLFENQEGTLVDASDACFCGIAMSGMGASVADYDRDGDPDLFVTAPGSSLLLQQLPDLSYVDVTLASGVPPMTLTQMGWGSAWLDYDNDGQLDLALMRGDLWDENSETKIEYDDTPQLLRQDQGMFTDVAPDLGMDPAGSWRSVVAVDLNGDGVVDPIFTDVVDRPQFFLSDACTDAGWVVVVGPVGARVEVDAGGRTQTAWIDTHVGMGASQPPLVHFGLGEAQTVDELRVTLTDGTRLITPPFEARRTVRIHSP